MLDCRPITPQDYRERSGFGRRREREWGHGGTAAGSIRSTHSCVSISSATTGSRCAARPPATVNDGEIAVASNEELRAAPLGAKRLLALWNALPGVEKRKKVGDR